MAENSNMHPLRKHLLQKGIIVRGWIRSRGLNERNATHCIYNGEYDPETVAKLRKENLYRFLTYKVRDKIEQAEKAREGNGGA